MCAFPRKILPNQRKYSKNAEENALTAPEKNVTLGYKRTAARLGRGGASCKEKTGGMPAAKQHF
jgi:hypothetical protein